MDIYRKNEYEYVLFIGYTRYELTGEWTAKAVAEFLKELTKEED